MDNFTFGVQVEKVIAEYLANNGATVKHHKNSKGPGATDVEASWQSGTKWLVQVKAARADADAPAMPSGEEIRRLTQRATVLGCTAVVALVHKGKVTFVSAKTQKTLALPSASR